MAALLSYQHLPSAKNFAVAPTASIQFYGVSESVAETQ